MSQRKLNKRISSLHLKLLQANFIPIDSTTPDFFPQNQSSTSSPNNSLLKRPQKYAIGHSSLHKTMLRKLRSNCNTSQTNLICSQNPSKILNYLDVDCAEIYGKFQQQLRQQRTTTKQNAFDSQVSKQKKLIKCLQKHNNLLHKEIVDACTKMGNFYGKKVKNIGEIRINHNEELSSINNSQILLDGYLDDTMKVEDNAKNALPSQFAVENKTSISHVKVLRKWPKLSKKASQNEVNTSQSSKGRISNSCHESSNKKAYQYQRHIVLNQFEGLYQKILKHKQGIKSGQVTTRHKKSQYMNKIEMNEEFIRKIPKTLSKKLQRFFGSKQMRVSELVKNLR